MISIMGWMLFLSFAMLGSEESCLNREIFIRCQHKEQEIHYLYKIIMKQRLMIKRESEHELTDIM